MTMAANNQKPPEYRLMDAYEFGELKGPVTTQDIAAVTGIGVQQIGPSCARLGFTKTWEPNGDYKFVPPKKGRKFAWPERKRLINHCLDRGYPFQLSEKMFSQFGPAIIELALEKGKRRPADSIQRLANEASAEINAIAAATAEEVITRKELAEALRESPNMPKAALLNRTRGLVKAATRKGNWKDHRQEGQSGTTQD